MCRRIYQVLSYKGVGEGVLTVSERNFFHFFQSALQSVHNSSTSDPHHICNLLLGVPILIVEDKHLPLLVGHRLQHLPPTLLTENMLQRVFTKASFRPGVRLCQGVLPIFHFIEHVPLLVITADEGLVLLAVALALHHIVLHPMVADQGHGNRPGLGSQKSIRQFAGLLDLPSDLAVLHRIKIVTMDTIAKKAAPDKDGVRIAELNEESYCYLLWDHKPLTDFWMIGPGKARKLEKAYLFTMGDVAHKAQYDEEWFYRTFGIDGEILIDHAFGIEPVTMADIKSYHSDSHSLSKGQVLPKPYEYAPARNVLREMIDVLCVDMFTQNLTAPKFSWWVS